MKLINNHFLHFVYPICITLVTGKLPIISLSQPQRWEWILINVICLNGPDLWVYCSSEHNMARPQVSETSAKTERIDICKSFSLRKYHILFFSVSCCSSQQRGERQMLCKDINLLLSPPVLQRKSSFDSSLTPDTFTALNLKSPSVRAHHIGPLSDIANAWHHDQCMPLTDVCFYTLTHNKALVSTGQLSWPLRMVLFHIMHLQQGDRTDKLNNIVINKEYTGKTCPFLVIQYVTKTQLRGPKAVLNPWGS